MKTQCIPLAIACVLAALEAPLHAQGTPELTGVAAEQNAIRIYWGTALDRYIVEQFDPLTGQSLAVGTSTGAMESTTLVVPSDPQIGFLRLRSGVQAVRLTDAQLEQAIRASVGDSKLTPTNWLYDVDVAGLTNLTVAMRGITTLEGLADLNDLVWFDLGGNQLTSLAELAASPDLQVLRIDGNQLTSVEGIEVLTDLRVLDLSHNQLADLSPVAALGQLEVLYADQNQLASADFAAGLLNLGTLDLSGNRLTTIAPLLQNAQNGGLGPGDSVYLAGNPLADEGEVAALRGYGVTVYFP